jgi:uncharacterized protein
MLSGLYGAVLVPPAVHAELLAENPLISPFAFEQFPFVQVRAPQRVLEFRDCDPGESEALSLALELHVSEVLVDEASARREAVRLGIRPTGVLAVLVKAKAEGLIPLVGPLIVQLQEKIRFRLSQQVRDDVLRQAGEL